MATVDLESLKSNSHKSKEEEAKKEEKSGKIQKVVTGKVTQRKFSTGEKFKEVFLAEDAKDVKNYFVFDLFIPWLKDGIYDWVTGIASKVLFGSGKPSSRRSGSVGEKTSYTAYYKSDRQSAREKSFVPVTRRNRFAYEDVVLESRVDAEGVLSLLSDVLYDYEEVSVADLDEAIGITGPFTDNKWGWKDLKDARVRRVNHGYVLDMPDPIQID